MSLIDWEAFEKAPLEKGWRHRQVGRLKAVRGFENCDQRENWGLSTWANIGRKLTLTSAVGLAIARMERAGLIVWVHRLKRIREWAPARAAKSRAAPGPKARSTARYRLPERLAPARRAFRFPR